MREPSLPLRVVVTGPESTGKTTLARRLARHFGVIWTPEFSRHYLGVLGRPYEPADLLEIAKGQLAWEAYTGYWAPRLFFSDTSLEVVKIWSDYRYGYTHPWILEQLILRPPALYLLCRPDLPWRPDPLRESPDLAERELLYEMYRKELQDFGVPLIEIGGIGEERMKAAVRAVNQRIIKPAGD